MHYETSYEWSGAGEEGTLAVAGLSPLSVGVPTEGDAKCWSPEHLLLAAAEICLVNTFLVISGMSKLAVKAYRSSASGELTLVPKEGYKFERITIRPVITVAEGSIERAERILEKSHRACLITRSFNFPVEVEPQFVAG